MRTTKELLIIVRDNLDKLYTGMCGLINLVLYPDLINEDERDDLLLYLQENMPEDAKLLWWWDMGEIEPRLKWLNEQIEKL